ncbi:MAG: signal recognition particle-docking protein FtsY [Acidimicrobiia bacterium]|nr:signal recognition particle-docking protein FtsY [Acidimicrobiia bacterium]
MDYLIIIIVVIAVLAAIAVVLLRRGRSKLDVGRATSSVASTPPPAVDQLPTAPSGLRRRLARTRDALGASLGSVFGSGTDDERWERLEDALILADVGPTTSVQIVEQIRRQSPSDEHELEVMLADALTRAFSATDRSVRTAGTPGAILVVGVNGAGKTTTIAKLTSDLRAHGSSVVLAAADTFRAAADSQLKVWGDRLGVDVVTGAQGADPASVAYEAIQKARTASVDVVVVDTAGRLHAHTNLMDELGKLGRVVEREAGGISEVLLVIDGSTGQNGITQARAFAAAVPVTGVVLTKLDGTSKGGIAVAVERDLGIPIKYIGVGEGVDDLIPFVPADFVAALLA